MDLSIWTIVGGAAALLLVVALFLRFRKPVDRFGDLDLVEPGADAGTRPAETWAEEDKSTRKKTRGADGSRCDHHLELTGFPPERIGTHVNLRCMKCGTVMTVTVEESEKLLRQRDDVREAVRKAQGG